jgi:hypothetical protein
LRTVDRVRGDLLDKLELVPAPSPLHQLALRLLYEKRLS